MSLQASAEEKESSLGAQRTTSPAQFQLAYNWDKDFENRPYLSCSAFMVFTEPPVTTVLT